MEKQWMYLNILNNDFVHISTENINKINNECYIIEADVADLFIVDDYTIFLKSTDIVPTRCRIDGVINASQRMLEAKKGRRPKRVAITVRYDSKIGKYIVIDGNSTFFVCQLWNIRNIPCTLEK